MKLQSNRVKNYLDMGLEEEDAQSCADMEVLIEAAFRDGSLKTRPSKASYWAGLVKKANIEGKGDCKWARIKLLEERLETAMEAGREAFDENKILRDLVKSLERQVKNLEERSLNLEEELALRQIQREECAKNVSA
jgi:hypothetical protein